MVDYGIKIAVKVGKRSSSIRFSKTKVYRAITVNNLKSILDKHRDCNILVIEGIYEDEQDDIVKLIDEFKKSNEHNIVLFYIEGQDDLTSGIADELNYDIYMEMDGLYGAIQRQCEVSVSTRIEDKRKYSDNIMEKLGVSFEDIGSDDDLIEEAGDVSQDTLEIVQKEREEIEDIQGKDDTSTEETSFKADLDRLDDDEYKQLIKDVRDANARVIYLERIVNAVKDEKKQIETRFNNIVSSDDILEDPISLQEYKDTLDSLKENQESLQKLQEEVEVYKEELAVYKESLKSSELELKEYLEELSTIREEKNSIAERLNEQLIEITDELDIKTKDIDSLTSKLEDTGEDRNRLLILSDSTNEKLEKKELELQEKEEDIEQLKNMIEELKGTISDKEKEVNDIRAEKDRAEVEFNEALRSKENEKNELKNTINKVELKLENIQKALDSKVVELSEKTNQYNDLVALAGDGGENIEAIANTNTVLKETISKLNNDIREIRIERDDILNKYSTSDQKIKSLESQAASLRDSLSVISQSGGGGLVELPPMDYKGRAKIISVYGNGSFGITTTAMTIANKLRVNSKTLYIDFDLSSPSADAWFNTPPLSRNVMGYTKGDYSYTGLGIVINQGLDFFINNIVNIIIPIGASRGGRLDYISGLYDEINPSKIAGADFSGLFNYLGNNYDYIVLDLGKLGGSNITDQLIKMFTNISHSSALVTINDYFKIRNSAMKLQALNIDFNKVNWVLNLGEDTILSDKSRKAMSPSKFTFIPYDRGVYGKREFITRGKISKDKFNLFMRNTVGI